jgi:5-methylcytosine-specific restriction protein B
VLGFIQIDDEDTVVPLVFLYSQNCTFVEKIKDNIPDFNPNSQLINKIAAPGVVAGIVSLSAPSPVSQAVSAVLDTTLITQCSSALSNAGMKVPEGVLSRFVASLLVKRFVILAGLSGSGKTKLAIAFAEWIKEFDEQLKVVSVGADWNGTESVFGYRDALDPNRFVKPVSGILDIVIKAEEDPSRPYFLILDEMNLSHVERYFSDFLSAMESDCEINLHTAEDAIDGVPPTIELPKNLFIIGTVNVDETTYMFSPKVLDRANVIEFTVEESDLKGFLNAPSRIDVQSIVGLGMQYQSAIVESAKRADIDLINLPSDIADGSIVQQEITEMLLQGFRLLKPIGAEFGFRTAIEVIRFTYFHAQLVGNGWKVKDSFDAQMVQKLMPKLHGSERRLRPVLDALEELCNASGLKLSGEKVSRMQDRLRDGFTSFLE